MTVPCERVVMEELRSIATRMISRDGMGAWVNVAEALCRIEDAIKRNTEALQLQIRVLTVITERMQR